MPMGPAARILDPVVHPAPGVLTPGPGSPNVIIGNKLAWRGVPAGAAAAISSAKATSDKAITAAEAATALAAGTPGLPAAKATEETTKATAATTMGAMITAAAGGADIHACTTPLPIPPHGPGVVIDGSPTVLINGLPACRQGDTIIEAVGPPDKIALGLQTVIIGNVPNTAAGGGGGGGGGAAAAKSDGAGAAGGGAAPDPEKAKAKTIADAIAKIEASDFAKTDAGKKVVAKIKQLNKDGKISFAPMAGSRGTWGGGKISVADGYSGDVDSTASELVHEATHAVYEDDFPASKTKLTIDEEMTTNVNQLDFYEEQRRGGFRDPELEDRRTDRNNGKLRDNVRSRYPGAPEHL
jgi:uncharacterized Zn-binding protein involved in type VI secretion